MFRKIIFIVFSASLCSTTLKAQDSIPFEYQFINSVYGNSLTNSSFYYLYFKPITNSLTKALEDTLSKYFTHSEIAFIQKEYKNEDTAFTWNQKLLINCKVIRQYWNVYKSMPENTGGITLKIDSLTGKPVIYRQKKRVDVALPFYCFSKPIRNSDSSLVILYVALHGENMTKYRTYVYQRKKGKWMMLKRFNELDTYEMGP